MSSGSTVAARDSLRRTLVLVSAIVCFETALFTVLAPLLPHLADRFGLSKSAAGALVACYAAGALLGAVPSGLLATRIGAKATALSGLLLLGAASAAFGVVPAAASLFAARLAQGTGCSLAWTGGLAWLLARTPSERRGEVIGVALAAAIAGALVGPALGTLANTAGTKPVFVALAVLLTLATFRRALSQPSLLAASLLIVLAGFLLGVISVLAPLHLARLGWSATGIGVIFLLMAAVNTAVNPLLGRWTDRTGRLAPLRLTLAVSTTGSVALAWSAGQWVYAGIVFAAGVAYALLWTPAMVLLSDAAAERGLGFVLAFALMNLAWSPGQLLGSTLGGVVAQLSSDAVPYVVAAALCLAAVASLEWSLRHPRSDGDDQLVGLTRAASSEPGAPACR